VHARHRALDDARLLWHFWRDIHREFPAGRISELVDALAGHVPWPDYLDPALPRLLPDTHGVYVMRDVNSVPLYVGRGARLRDKVLSHFQPGNWKSAKARRLAEQVRSIEWQETGGAIGAPLHENRLLRALSPLHNRRARSPMPAGDTHWPYDGPVGIREARIIHVVEGWQFLGSAADDQALYDLLDGGRAEYDHEVHRILRDRLALVPLLKLDRRRTA